MTSIERILVVSDCTDIAYAEMRGAIIRSARAQGATSDPVIEPLVPVSNFSVLNASFVLRLMAESYGPETLLMFVMNSLVERTERIVGTTKHRGFTFEGTNTGAVGWLANEFGVESAYELHDPGFLPFGGKFVHAPAVGKIVAGVPLDELGTPFPHELIRRVIPRDCQIVHIDNFGNAKFALAAKLNIGEQVNIVAPNGWSVEATFGRRMMEFPDGAWVLYPGSSLNLYELGQVRSLGLRGTGVSIGDELTITSIGGERSA